MDSVDHGAAEVNASTRIRLGTLHGGSVWLDPTWVRGIHNTDRPGFVSVYYVDPVLYVGSGRGNAESVLVKGTVEEIDALVKSALEVSA